VGGLVVRSGEPPGFESWDGLQGRPGLSAASVSWAHGAAVHHSSKDHLLRFPVWPLPGRGQLRTIGDAAQNVSRSPGVILRSSRWRSPGVATTGVITRPRLRRQDGENGSNQGVSPDCYRATWAVAQLCDDQALDPAPSRHGRFRRRNGAYSPRCVVSASRRRSGLRRWQPLAQTRANTAPEPETAAARPVTNSVLTPPLQCGAVAPARDLPGKSLAATAAFFCWGAPRHLRQKTQPHSWSTR